MERCWLVLWISITCLFGGALPQYRDKNIMRTHMLINFTSMVLNPIYVCTDETEGKTSALDYRKQGDPVELGIHKDQVYILDQREVVNRKWLKSEAIMFQSEDQLTLVGMMYRQRKRSGTGRETDAVQAILARYLQKRLQGAQVFSPPPPSVLFDVNRQPRARKTEDNSDEADVDLNRTDSQERREDYDDYEDDLQGFEDSECSRTRINLFDDCPNCVDEHTGSIAASRWTMPLLKLGEKRYYLGIFFKANWYRASQYCRYHGMHLASIASQEENDRLEKHIKDFGLGHEHFWTSGTDQAEEGTFFWMANGRPITFENWNVGEPNNFRYENGEEEHCLELWNRDGKGLKWNDSPCSFETFFVCEVQ